MGDVVEPPAEPPRKRTLRERLKEQFDEYGKIAIITYLSLSFLAIVGFSIAIGMGVEPSDATGVLGVIFAGWIAAKATMPIRILITLALTPAIAALVVRKKRTTAPADAPGVDEP
jgi:preprotein translocase subunit Sss1